MMRLPATLGDMTGRSGTRTMSGPGAGAAFHRTSVLELAPLPSAVPCARLHAVAVLHEWGLRDLAEDAALIVSELITNAAGAAAILPDRPPVTLRLLASATSLIIEAWDHSPAGPEPRGPDPDPEAEGGRGLTVVAALSHRWGWERTGHHRKVVWAEVRITPGR
jgi:anti-sigma regulatory factor (Ser/Thr protein kinase)